MTIHPTFAQDTPIQAPRRQRARGVASVRFEHRRGASRIADLRMSGSAKLLFPHGAGATAVSLNTAGGVTGGDRFRLRVTVGENANATVTTQAAERLYAAIDHATGHIANRLIVGKAGTAHWLPQETILFEGARVARSLNVSLAEGAQCLIVEPIAFGRLAMGERLTNASFSERWTVTQGNKLLFADRLRLNGAIDDQLDKTAGGARAMASVLWVSPRAEADLAPARAMLPATGAANLVRDGLLYARVFAPDSFALRKSLVPLLEHLRQAPLPRTWMI